MYCRLDNDKWEYAGKRYFVHSKVQRMNSTAVELTLEDDNGNIFTTVVANHQIEWIEE